MTITIRGILRVVRRLPERLLHPVRRARIHHELKSIPASPEILVVCLGNICRSPYASLKLDAEFRGLNRRDVIVVSGGFIQPGRPSPPAARASAASRGLDLEGHRSRVMQPETVDRADLVLVMSHRQRRDIASQFGRTKRVLILGDIDPERPATRTIRDPNDQSRDVFTIVYDRLDRCCTSIAHAISSNSGSAHRTGEESGKAGNPAKITPEDQPHGSVGEDGQEPGGAP